MKSNYLHSREHSRNIAWSSVAPWAAVLGGGALAIYGVSRKSLSGMALAGAGTYAAIWGAKTQSGPPAPVHVQKTFTIDRSPEELYSFWRNFENLPRFMKHLKSVSCQDDRNSHWVANGPMGVPVEWDAEVLDDKPNEYLVWRSLPGSTISNRGSVEFRRAPNGSGTEVTVALNYHNPAGKLGIAFAKMVGREPEQQVREDLRRFKELMEAGEIATVVGQSSGPRSAVGRMMEAAYQRPEATQRMPQLERMGGQSRRQGKRPQRQTATANFQSQSTGTEGGGAR